MRRIVRTVAERLGFRRAGSRKREAAGTGVGSGLVVTCAPNPCNQHAHPDAPEPPYPYMWFYRTEVRNILDVPLRITRFEGYIRRRGRWVANNITGRRLTARDFDEWYQDGVRIVDGVIPPGAVAVDACNWHAASTRAGVECRWAYWAVDPDGREHFAEAVVGCVPIGS